MQKGGVAWTFIDLAVSRLAVQIDDRHRRRKETAEPFSRKYNKGRFVRPLCVCVHLSSAVRSTRRRWQGNSLSFHYLWVVCLSAGLFCHDIIMALT